MNRKEEDEEAGMAGQIRNRYLNRPTTTMHECTNWNWQLKQKQQKLENRQTKYQIINRKTEPNWKLVNE